MTQQHVFVSGTNTGIGKTIVCSWLCQHWQADYWKPIQSGIDGETDSETCKRLSPATRIHPEQYKLQQPLSPHEAAKQDNVLIKLNQFQKPAGRKLIIEGAGGLLVPLNSTEFIIDLIKYFNTPVLLVASSMLGTINHTLLSLGALRQHHINCLGVILVGAKNQKNKQAIEHFGQTAVLDELTWFDAVNQHCLAQHPPSEKLKHTLDQLSEAFKS